MKERIWRLFFKTAKVGLETDKRKQDKFFFFSCSSSPYISLNSCYHRNQFLRHSIKNFFHFDGDVDQRSIPLCPPVSPWHHLFRGSFRWNKHEALHKVWFFLNVFLFDDGSISILQFRFRDTANELLTATLVPLLKNTRNQRLKWIEMLYMARASNMPYIINRGCCIDI